MTMVGEEALCECLLASARAVDRQIPGGNDQQLQRPLDALRTPHGGGMLSSTQSIVVDEVFHSTSENRLGTAVRQPVQQQVPRWLGCLEVSEHRNTHWSL